MIRRMLEFTRGREARGADGGDGSAARSNPRFGVPRLVVTRGRGIGLDEAVSTHCLIGRTAGSDVVLSDASVSRRHARIALEGDEYVVRDLGSCNGTFVNGRSVEVATLRDGDVLRVGHVELVFRRGEGRDAGRPRSPSRGPGACPRNARREAIGTDARRAAQPERPGGGFLTR
jgi:hypothetical protein